MNHVNFLIHKFPKLKGSAHVVLSYPSFKGSAHVVLSYPSFKGSVYVVLSYPPFKECHIRFTTMPYKPLADQK